MKKLTSILFCSIAVLVASAQDILVSFPSDTLTLYGTLTLPSGIGPFPVAVFVHGSGPNDRDQTIPITGGNAACLYPGIYNDTIRNFRDLAEGFRSNGIAVLRYDKRSFTYSTQLNVKSITPYDFISDVHSAIDYVKTRSEIDTNCIILLGHSQGGNFIPIVAKQRNDISALLSLGTTASGIDSIFGMQLRELFYYCLKDTITGDATYNQTINDFQQIRGGIWDPNTPYLGAYTKFWEDWIDITDSSLINFNAVSQPTLFLHAMEDFNIPFEDAKRYETQLSTDTFNVFYLDGLNHYFTTASNHLVAKVVTDTIFYWLQQNKFYTSIRKLSVHNNPITVLYGKESIDIIIDSPSAILIKMFDTQGKLVEIFDTRGMEKIEIWKRNYVNGMYILTGKYGKQSVSEKIMIKN